MVYRTMQGKEIDMEKLMRQNELTQAVSNKNVNARGDELGPGGKIIKKREEVIAEYYEKNPKAAKKSKAPSTSIVEEVVEEPVTSTKTKNTRGSNE
jgi:hypothetical protein